MVKGKSYTVKIIAENADEKIALLELLEVALEQADKIGEPTVAIHINSAIETLKVDVEDG